MKNGILALAFAASAALAPQIANSADIIQNIDANCSCVTAGTSGSISFTAGEVQVSDATGYSQAAVGSVLVSGSQLNVGASGRADISVGNSCDLSIGPNSSVSISAADSQSLCVQVSSIGAPASTPAQTSSIGGNGGLILLGLGAAAGVAVLLSDDDDSDPTSN